MTPEQQIVFDAVMQALRVHAVKIEDLTPVSDVPTGAYVELSGGRRISASSFANVISNIILEERVLPLINGEAQSRVEADNALSGLIAAETTARENAISNLSQVARGYTPKSRLDTLNGLSQLGLWRIGSSPSVTSSQSNYGNVLVYADYGNYVHQMYFGSLDPNTWTTPESGKKQNIYGRSYHNNAWTEWERVNGDKSDIIDLGEFERSGDGEAKAATLKYCADPNILFMKYTITGKGVATIQQSVVGSRCQQLLLLEGQWFTRYISFTTASREFILQVTAWWRTMPTNVDYNINTRRVRLVDYNRAHSLPNNNPNTDGFELPLATESTDGLMSGKDKAKFEELKKTSIQKLFHVLIDYNGSLVPIQIVGNNVEVVCRYTANPYEGAAPTTIFKPACRCAAKKLFGEYTCELYNSSEMSESSRLYPAMDGTIEIAQGVTIWVKFKVKIDYSILGSNVSFTAGCAFSNFEADEVETRTPVLAYVDEESVDFAHNGGKIHLHTQAAGKTLSVHGKKFAGDWRYALKVEAEGMTTGGDYGITTANSPRADIEFTITKRETVADDALVVSYNNYTFEVPLA